MQPSDLRCGVGVFPVHKTAAKLDFILGSIIGRVALSRDQFEAFGGDRVGGEAQ